MVDNELGDRTDECLEEFKRALYASGYPVVSDEEIRKLYDTCAVFTGLCTEVCSLIVESLSGLAMAVVDVVNAISNMLPDVEASTESLQELAYEHLDPKVEFGRMLGRQNKRNVYMCQSQYKQPHIRKRVHRSVYSARPPPATA